MKNLSIFIGIIVSLVIVGQANSQPSVTIHKDKLSELAFMIGEWTGAGKMSNQDGTWYEFTQWEKVEYDLNGAAILIHGKGYDLDGNLVHNALGVISYDPAEERYFMNSFLENGRQTKANIEIIEPGKLKWWFDTEQGATISYELSVNNGIWTEAGSYSPTPERSFPFIDFTLTKE